MRNLILLMLITLFTKVGAQTFCYTSSSSSTPELSSSLASKSQTYVPDSYYLRIYVHVIRRSDGTGGQSVADVNEALGYLDTDFNTHNIYFEWDGQINYINDDDQYIGPQFDAPFNWNPMHEDGIDILMYDDNAIPNGQAYGVGENSAFYISGTFSDAPFDSIVKSHMISHEMGHVCFLWHTHHQKETGCTEYVDGSNSDVCGDFVLDTPPDPGLEYDVDHLTCQWSYDPSDPDNYDPNGVLYNPDEANIMSYSKSNCLSYFSLGQVERMRNAIESLPHLIDATVDGGNCPTQLNIIKVVASGSTDTNHAYNSITASNIMESGSTADYKAGQEINLNPGFYAESGSIFTADIEPCTTSSSSSKISNTKKGSTVSEELIELDNDLRIFPNPTADILNIASKEDLSEIFITDITGKTIYHAKAINSKSFLIDMKSLNSGIYFMKTRMRNGAVSTNKIIKD